MSEIDPGIRIRLRTKLALLVTALILAIILPLSYFAISETQAARRAEVRNLSAAIAKMIAHVEVTGITTGRRVPNHILDQHLSNAFALNNQIAYIVIMDHDGSLRSGKVNSDLVSLKTDYDEVRSMEYLAQEGKGLADDLIVDTVEIDDGKKRLGTVKVAFTVRPIMKQLQEDIFRYLIVTAVLVAMGIAASNLFAVRISRPVEALAGAMQKVRDGDFDVNVKIRSSDEIGRLASSFNFMTMGLKEREWIRNTFTKYVSRQVAEKILREKNECDFEGELRNVTVLFCDIRGFTSLSENLSPKEIIALLNEYFGAIIEIVFKYEGTLDKFVGDQIMAVFGAPLDQQDTELRAVRTAVEIQQAVYGLNEKRKKEGKPLVNMGIGINTGEAVAGNVGSEMRTSYTVVGDEVNLAQRIESQSPKGDILISEKTYLAVRDFVEATALGKVGIKGKEKPIELYSIDAVRL